MPSWIILRVQTKSSYAGSYQKTTVNNRSNCKNRFQRSGRLVVKMQTMWERSILPTSRRTGLPKKDGHNQLKKKTHPRGSSFKEVHDVDARNWIRSSAALFWMICSCYLIERRIS